MKPTQKQIELIRAIESIVKSWRVTNDIDSPTHYSDIEEGLQPFVSGFDVVEHTLAVSEIESRLGSILRAIKHVEKQPLTKEQKLEWLNSIRNDRKDKET